MVRYYFQELESTDFITNGNLNFYFEGGAMVKSTCPDCKAVIGGENHALEPGNLLAPEMDGAVAPAWPTNLQPHLP